MRLGEILVGAQVITPHQLEHALQMQVMLGARLGTRLVELGHIDLDGLANALAHQHGLPAALAHHFDRADQSLQLRMSAGLAERFACVPLLRVGKRAAVIAATGRQEPRAIAIIADELGFDADRLIVSIAPELRIRYTLERVFKISRPQKFLRAPGTPRPMPVACTFPNVEFPPVDEPPEPPIRPNSDTGERRKYVRTLAESRSDESPIEVISDSDLEELADDDLLSSVDMIAAGRDREEIASHTISVIRHLVPLSDAAVLLSLRGAIAVSSASFRRNGPRLPSIALPIDQAGAIATGLCTKALVRTEPRDHTEIDLRLLSSLGLDGAHLVVAPLVAGARAVAMLVVASRSAVDSAVIETIAGAAAAGFARLMREAIE